MNRHEAYMFTKRQTSEIIKAVTAKPMAAYGHVLMDVLTNDITAGNSKIAWNHAEFHVCWLCRSQRSGNWGCCWIFAVETGVVAKRIVCLWERVVFLCFIHFDTGGCRKSYRYQWACYLDGPITVMIKAASGFADDMNRCAAEIRLKTGGHWRSLCVV